MFYTQYNLNPKKVHHFVRHFRSFHGDSNCTLNPFFIGLWSFFFSAHLNFESCFIPLNQKVSPDASTILVPTHFVELFRNTSYSLEVKAPVSFLLFSITSLFSSLIRILLQRSEICLFRFPALRHAHPSIQHSQQQWFGPLFLNYTLLYRHHFSNPHILEMRLSPGTAMSSAASAPLLNWPNTFCSPFDSALSIRISNTAILRSSRFRTTWNVRCFCFGFRCKTFNIIVPIMYYNLIHLSTVSRAVSSPTVLISLVCFGDHKLLCLPIIKAVVIVQKEWESQSLILLHCHFSDIHCHPFA